MGLIDRLANELCALLGDAHPRYWMKLLWRLSKLWDTGIDQFDWVQRLLERTHTDRLEGFARSAGALFVSRLTHSLAQETG